MIRSNENNVKRFDIISGLMNTTTTASKSNLSVVQSVFLHLTELDLCNAIKAHSNWIKALTNDEQWLSEYFADKNSSWLKAITFKTWQQQRRESTQDTSTILKEACSCYAKLLRNSTRRPGGAAHSVVHPFDFLRWEISKTFVNDDYIVVVFSKRYEKTPKCTFLMYNRWTLEMVNAFSAKGSIQVQLAQDAGSQPIVLNIVNKHHTNSDGQPITTAILNPTTANVEIVTTEHYHSTRHSNLLLIYKLPKRCIHDPGTLYKLERDGQLALLKEIVTMPPRDGIVIRANPNLGIVGMYLDYGVLEIRSKCDMSLVRAFQIPHDQFYPFYLLSDCFVASVTARGHSIQVRSLHIDSLPIVYQFIIFDTKSSGSIARQSIPTITFNIEAGHVVALVSGGESAIVWHLPSDFLDECRRRSLDGSAGELRESRVVAVLADQRCPHRSDHLDHFGITRIEHEFAYKLLRQDFNHKKIEMTVGTFYVGK